MEMGTGSLQRKIGAKQLGIGACACARKFSACGRERADEEQDAADQMLRASKRLSYRPSDEILRRSVGPGSTQPAQPKPVREHGTRARASCTREASRTEPAPRHLSRALQLSRTRQCPS